MQGRFANKVAVITGAAGGIGRATAVRFAAEGARAVLVDLPSAPLDEARAAAEQAGGEALAVPADVRSAADVQGYVAAATQRFGGIDCFFNNAGIEGWSGPCTEYPEEIFDQVLAVNVKGVWLGMKYVAPAMRERGGGAIVNTASMAGLQPTPNIIAYGASKHAVIGMTTTAAQEFAPDNIRVNAVCPGPIETDMMRRLERAGNPDDPGAARVQRRESLPFGRYGEPDEVAALVAFLCSEDAAYISGAAYPIHGAYR